MYVGGTRKYVIKPLQIDFTEQVFNTPWASTEKHMKSYYETVNRLVSLPYFDSNICILLQLVTLFSTLGLDHSQIEEPEKIDEMQEAFVFKLLSYLRRKTLPSQSNGLIHKYLTILAELRTLAEMVTRNNWAWKNTQQIILLRT